MLRNEEERAQALRVVRRVVAVVGAAGGVRRQRGAYVEHGLLRCLASVARAASGGDGAGGGDRLSRPAIATLAEICKYCHKLEQIMTSLVGPRVGPKQTQNVFNFMYYQLPVIIACTILDTYQNKI